MKKGSVPAAVPYRDYLLKRLADPAIAAAYLNAAAKERDTAAFLQALRNVVDAHGGIAKIATRTDLNRQAVYRMLSEKGNPEFKSLQSLLGATGLELNVVTVAQKKAEYALDGPGTVKTKRKRKGNVDRAKLAA